MADRALVRNAADPEQVGRARRKDHDAARDYQDALRASLQYPEVRYVFSHLIERANRDASRYESSGSALYFREGARSFVATFRKELEDADDRLVEQMDRERRDRQRREDRGTDASHIRRAEEATADES
jgi:hypothetical protein